MTFLDSDNGAHDIQSRAAAIRLAVFDVDGVMTDGRLYLDAHGGEIKTLHVRDGLGLKRLQAAGIDNKLLLTIIAQHHEQADGSGYPKGLSGTEIRPEAEILALAERYVAMITKRAYRQRMNVADARKLIANLADGKFRPAIPKALLQILGEYPPGILVRLENNEVGVVTRRPVRARGPFVKAIFGSRGNRYTGTFERDTSEPDFGIQSLEEPEVMPSMDFSLVWGFRS